MSDVQQLNNACSYTRLFNLCKHILDYLIYVKSSQDFSSLTTHSLSHHDLSIFNINYTRFTYHLSNVPVLKPLILP